MTFEKALEYVRDSYPDNLVTSASEYDGKFIFSLRNYKVLIPGDSTGFYVSVDADGTVSRFDYFKILWSDKGLDMVNTMNKTIRFVDVTEEDLEKTANV